MNIKYEKFYETDMYIFYGQYAFEEDVKLEQKEEYEKILYDFKKILNIQYELEEEEYVIKYINLYEPNVNEEDTLDFIKFCKIILEKLYGILDNLKKQKKLSTQQTIKNMQMDSKRIQRLEIIREKEQQRLREKDQRNLLRQQKEDEKLKERESKRLIKEQIELEKINNKRIIKCDCGLEFAYYSRFNHLKSHDHILRLEGIRYFIKEHNLNFNI
jgi:hypothetical protein